MFHLRPDSPLHLPNEELVLGYLKFSAKGTKREVFGMPIPGSLIIADIQEASYYQEYLVNVAKHRRYLAGETGSDQDSPAPKPTKPARKPKSTTPKDKKRKQATETSHKPPEAKKSKYCFIGKKRFLKSMAVLEAEDVPAMEPQVAVEDANLQKALEESMKTEYAATPRGLLPPVVIKKPKSGNISTAPRGARKGQSKDCEEESKKVVLGANEGGQDEGQAGPDPSAQAESQTGSDAGAQDEGQAGSNPDENSEGQTGPDPGNTRDDVQSIPSPMVHARSDCEHMDLDVADVSPQPSTVQLCGSPLFNGSLTLIRRQECCKADIQLMSFICFDDLESSAASATISAAKPSIPTAAPTVVAAYTRRRKGVIIRDPEEELSSKTPAETPKLKDKGKGILIKTPKPMKKKDQIELDAEYARKLHEEINKDHEEINKDHEEVNKDIGWDAAIDYVKQKSKNPQYIKRYQVMKKRPQTESEARKNIMIYLKNTVGYKLDFFKGMSYVRFVQSFKLERRKLNEEAQEAEDLKKHLEVVDDEDDDVFTKTTPLARK
nr:E-beta-farnesene synthase [Tanacetum cinerariifolium]